MRLSCLLLAIGCTGLQLLMANTGKGQDLNEIRLTLELKNESLKTAFTRIEKQTDFRFAYSKRQVENYKNISLARAEYTIQQALEALLANTRLSFKQVSNKIIILEKDDIEVNEKSQAGLSLPLVPQTDGSVKGKITNEKGEPIFGASIQLTGVTKGTAADSQGNFVISGIKAGTYKLLVSAVGFENFSREIVVKDGQTTELVFQLRSVNLALDEVVVTGYSRQSKRDVTGAVSSISADVISQTPVTDVTSILQGRIAGITVDGQGGPGNEQVVRVRGIGTLGNNDPLYVIDGVQTTTGLSLINQNDIESITVLKDAASCALYGARGSNGVIVITTKRGKNGAPKLEYNGYIGEEIPRKFPSVQTPQQYADALWAYYKNSNQTPSSSLYGNGPTAVLPDYIIEETGGPTNYGVSANDPAADPSLYNLSNYRILKANKTGTDWFKQVFHPALTQSHQLALSGATDKSNYALTFNYTDDNGILKSTYFKRYSIRVNTEFKVKPWLRLGENMQFAFSQGNTLNSHTDQNVVAGIYQASPLLPVYDIAGNLAGTKGALALGSNPYTSTVTSKNNKGYTGRMLGSAYGEVEPLKGLVFQSRIAIDYTPYQYRYFYDTLPQEPYSSQFTTFSEYSGYAIEWRSTNKLSYEITINDLHKINAFIAYEASEYNTRNMGGSNDSLAFTTPGFLVLGTGRLGPTRTLSGGTDKLSYISEFGSVNYSFSNKYLASFTIRRDGSSKFGPLRKYGVFPSASVGWRVSSESFMDKVRWINDLKLRAAWGTSGNEATLSSGQTVNQYYTNPTYTYYDLGGTNNSAMLGFALTQIGNPYLQWEVNKTINIGFDASFLNNRLTASFNWFRRLTDKLLYQPPVTSLQGDAGAPFQNVMNFVNKGIELELGYFSSKGSKFRYEMNLNFATYRNKVTYISADTAAFIPGGLYARQTNLTRSVVGKPVSSFYGYVYEGIFQNADEVSKHATQSGYTPENGAGHFKFKDISGPNGKPDGIVDQYDRTFIGSPHPKFTYGYNLNLYYKNFDLGIFLQGVYGNKIFNYWRTAYEWPGMLGTGSLDTWTPTHTNAKLPIWSSTLLEDNRPSTFFVESGSYLRLKSLQLGYTFPNLKGISKLRVYAQAFNILTFTKYSGMDPEVNSGSPSDIGIDFGGYYPVSMKLLFGVNLGL